MISVKGISISKTRSEFFNLKRFRGVECKIQAGIVNARIKNVTKKISQLLNNPQSGIFATVGGRALRFPNRARLSTHINIRQAMRLHYSGLVPPQIMPSFMRPASLIIF
jgi:hypothetical protein